MSQAKHPLLRGYFAICSEEPRAARGLPSSGDFEKSARKCDQNAAASMSAARDFDRLLEEVEKAALRAVAEAPELRAHIEANTDEMREGFKRAKEERLEATRQHQARANELHRYAEEARAFEARFDCNPYVDRFRDAVEKHNAQVSAEQEKKRRKAQERREARG